MQIYIFLIVDKYRPVEYLLTVASNSVAAQSGHGADPVQPAAETARVLLGT